MNTNLQKFLALGSLIFLLVLTGIFLNKKSNPVNKSESTSEHPTNYNPKLEEQTNRPLVHIPASERWVSTIPTKHIKGPRYYDFSYPANWHFSCCGDTDLVSFNHLFSDDPSKYIVDVLGTTQAKSTAIITGVIFRDYGFSICPDLVFDSICSLEERIWVNADEFYKSLFEKLEKELSYYREYNIDGFAAVGLTGNWNNEPVEFYLVKSNDQVTGIEFRYPDLLGRDVINKLLDSFKYR
jgi:hypothetical protein